MVPKPITHLLSHICNYIKEAFCEMEKEKILLHKTGT